MKKVLEFLAEKTPEVPSILDGTVIPIAEARDQVLAPLGLTDSDVRLKMGTTLADYTRESEYEVGIKDINTELIEGNRVLTATVLIQHTNAPANQHVNYLGKVFQALGLLEPIPFLTRSNPEHYQASALIDRPDK
jgi:hypothetical protein